MTSQVSTRIVGPTPSVLSSGESTLRLNDATLDCQPTSGQLRITYFTAAKTEAITQVRLLTRNTASAATPSLIRVGIWEEDQATGDLTPIASTANDITLLASVNTAYTKILEVSFTKTRGHRYAVGQLVVSAATMPSFHGIVYAGAALTGEAGMAQRTTALMAGQTDLPSGTIAAASLTVSAHAHYVVLVP